jgi:GNAT superfamily N-acetyltransferase
VEVIKIIPKEDYDEMKKIVEEYLTGTEEIKAICENFPTAAAGYYICGKLIGCAYGFASPWGVEAAFSLDGICIVHPYNGAGRGGKLLAFWEKRVYEMGFRSVDLGCAGGYVERFYLKNGYTPIELKILVKGGGWKEKQKNYPFPVAEVQTQGEFTKLVLAVKDYASMNKDEITKHYGGEDSFFVFKKNLM